MSPESDTTSEFSVVVFDLGNVLIPWSIRSLYDQLIDDPVELDYFLGNVLTSDVNRRLDSGVPLGEVTADLIAKHPEYAELIDAFRTRWSETVGEPIGGSVELLRALLDSGVRCVALTNFGRDTFDSVKPRYPFLAWFEGIVVSGYERVTKPDARLYEILCERYGFVPSEAFFIDDSPANIGAAAALGFGTHLFTDPEALAADLRSRRLLN